MQGLGGALVKSSARSFFVTRRKTGRSTLIRNSYTLGTVSFCTFATLANGAGQDIVPSEEVAASGKLSIANTIDYAPFEYIGEDGNPTGIVVELAGAVAELLGVELDLQRTPFPALMPGLASGRFSIAWETFSVTPERLEQVDFIVFLQGGLAVSTRPDLLEQFSGEADICGKHVGVSAGSASDFLVDRLDAECVARRAEEVDKSIFGSSQDIVQAVLSGRIDARVDDATASSYFERVSGGQLVVTPLQYDVTPLGLAIANDDAETAQMMLSALERLFENGVYETVLERHGMGAYAVEAPYFVDSLDDLRSE